MHVADYLVIYFAVFLIHFKKGWLLDGYGYKSKKALISYLKNYFGVSRKSIVGLVTKKSTPREPKRE